MDYGCLKKQTVCLKIDSEKVVDSAYNHSIFDLSYKSGRNIRMKNL